MVTTPKEFLKSRHPDQFSDSQVVSENPLSRTILEYHLSTLTSRSQETDFERFAKRLCEIEICPNLVSHTGPTGGGDSKVDTETYPVSDQTSLVWFTGIGNQSAQERWGFAFSTKRDWRPKIRDDIKKIIDTNRGYKVVYFISSQSIKDKDRAKIQDELKEKYGIPVWIHDRTWILDCVFRKKHEDIAREELRLDLPEQYATKKGPQDSQRQENIEVLDKEIEKAVADGSVDVFLVDKALKSAILARQLERPRSEIDSRFLRAERLAREYGNEYQRFDVAYQIAWTTFWWHEDFTLYAEQYKNVEKQAGTENIFNLERLTNLWFVLQGLTYRNKTISIKVFKKHTRTLKNRLSNLSVQEDKPSAALQAKSILLEIELLENVPFGRSVSRTLRSLKDVVIQSKGLIGFPFRALVQMLTESGVPLEGNPDYDDLFKTILSVVEERDGELASANLMLDRGEKLIETGHPYEAIKILGVAQGKLYKEESREDIVRALFLCSIAYEDVGLLWAARGSLLSAASLATSDFWRHGDINIMQAACYRRLKWLELRLGRLPQMLEWHLVDMSTRNALARKGLKQERIFDKMDHFDLAVGIVFLRTNPTDLAVLSTLPDTLDDLGLYFSSVALIYALGGSDQLPREFMEAVPAEEIADFFVKWAKQYSPRYLPPSFTFLDSQKSYLSSNILGCKIGVEAESKQPCLEVAESLLAAIESFLSTTTLMRAASRESEIKIQVTSSSDLEKQVEFSIDDNSDPVTVTVRCKEFNPHSITRADQESLRSILFDAVAHTAGRIVMFEDTDKELDGLMRDERASDRALNLTSSFVTIGNVLGHHPKIRISDWINTSKKKYNLSRTEPVTTDVFEDIAEETTDKELDRHSARQSAKHTDMQTISIIKEPLWNEAKWSGVGYCEVATPQGEIPPLLVLLFHNIEYGKKIFSAWRGRFGNRDTNDEIRVSIVTGIDEANPYHYNVGIGSKIVPPEKGIRFIISPTRIHTMTPQSLSNLNRFKKSYAKFGCYWLVPGYIGTKNSAETINDLSIAKKEITFREAWQIGPNDPDISLLDIETKPIIPKEIKNPPVLKALEAKRRMRR